jgi:hypothetical protein
MTPREEIYFALFRIVFVSIILIIFILGLKKVTDETFNRDEIIKQRHNGK